MPRVIRGLGALTVLLLGTVGVPLALAALGGNPLPAGLTWSSVRDALVTPDDGTILVGLITAVGWIAWAVFAISVISELVALASRQRIQIRLPGLAGPQRLAAGLLISVITMATAPQLVQAQSPPATAVTVQPTAKAVPARPEAPEPVAPCRSPAVRAKRTLRAIGTWCDRATTCGASPRPTTDEAGTGARSRWPIRRFSPEGLTG